MSENSRSRVTITLGRSGQVVKRAGPALDSSFSESQPAAGSKRPVRERLGSNVDATQHNKRQRGDCNNLSINAANGMEDMHLGKDDLRFKIMRKIVLSQPQSNGQQNGVDLREMLSRTARPSTSLSGRQRMPQPNDARQHMIKPKDATRCMTEPKDARLHMPEPRDAGILGRFPSMRSTDALPPMVSSRSSYSPWTLDRLRRRSPDGVLGTSRGLSPQRNEKELQRRPLVRAYDDVRTVSYMNKDVFELSRPMASASFMAKPVLPAAPVKPVAPLLPPPLPPSGIVQKSSYTVNEQLTVDSLLHSLGLEKYAICFKAEEIDMAVLKQMGDNDLKDLGIPMGPRKKILLALLPRSKWQL